MKAELDDVSNKTNNALPQNQEKVEISKKDDKKEEKKNNAERSTYALNVAYDHNGIGFNAAEKKILLLRNMMHNTTQLQWLRKKELKVKLISKKLHGED